MAKTIRDINYFLQDPNNLLNKKPRFRGGDTTSIYTDTPNNISPNQSIKDEIRSSLKLYPISQDLYECEYHPHLHKILINNSFPRISVRIGDKIESITKEDMVMTLPLQKNIHNIHTLYLAVNPMEHTLLTKDASESDIELFADAKQGWIDDGMERIKSKAISRQKRVGDVGVLFRVDKDKNRIFTHVLSHVEGKHIIPNVNEYGEFVSNSLHYITDDNREIIDTYDDKYFYRHEKVKNGEESINNTGWKLIDNGEHLFSRCPLLYQSGHVAWEFVQSPIEMYEFLYNIYCAVVRKFGTFALFINGEFNWDENVKGDQIMMVLNQTDPEGKGDMKVIDYPKPDGLIELMKSTKEEIEQGACVVFISPERIKSSGDALSGTAVSFVMLNNLALAKQTVEDWAQFTDDMFFLYREAKGLIENNVGKYTKLKTKSRLSVWMPKSDTEIITNMNMLNSMGAISNQTKMEIAPLVAPDEIKRKQKEDAEALKQQQELARKQQVDETIVVDKLNK